MANVSDEALIERSKEGDMEAFKALISQHEGKVAGILHAMLGTTPEAEDIGQAVFVQLFDSLSKMREPVADYLVRNAIQSGMHELERRKHPKGRYHGTTTTVDFLGDEVILDAKQQLGYAFAQLDARLQAVVVLRLIEGYSVEKTASILDISKDAVLTRLAEAQQELRKGISEKL